MALAVDRVLETRRQLGRGSNRLGVMASTVLHGGFIAAMLLTPLLGRDAATPVRIVPVTLMSAQALGVRDPVPTSPPERSAPEPAPPQPAPPQPSPRVEAPSPKPTLTEPTRRESREPEAPTSTPAAPSAPPTLQRRQGSPTGTTTGTATMGARVGFDNPNFRHSYYIDQMTSMLSAQWLRPSISGELAALVHFRIHRDGTVTDLEIVESSGYNSYDLAALRAVQRAVPFPPLPQSFSESSLGVTVEFI